MNFVLIISILGGLLTALAGCNNKETNDNSQNINAYICSEGSCYELEEDQVIINSVSELNEVLKNISPNSDDVERATKALKKYDDEFFKNKKICIKQFGANVGTNFEIVNARKDNDCVKVEYKQKSNIKEGNMVITVMHYELAVVEIDKDISSVTFEYVK